MMDYSIVKNKIVKFSADYLYRAHKHEHVEIIYNVSGQCMMSVQNEDIALCANDCIIINKNVEHNFYVNGVNGCKINQLEINIAGDMLESPYVKISDAHMIANCLNNILTIQREIKSDSVSARLVSMEVEKIVTLGNYYLPQSNTVNIYAAKAVMLIKQCYSDDITCAGVADSVGVSGRYLRRIFLLNLGITPKEYITNLRMEKAKRLLISTNDSISDIAGYVGYNTIQYFSEIFKSRIGITPSEFRAAYVNKK